MEVFVKKGANSILRERLSKTKCRCSRICPLPEGEALLGKQARRIASWIRWIGDKLGEIKIKWRDNCINGATD